MQLIFRYGFLLLLLPACTRHSGDVAAPESMAATLTIAQPLAGAIFHIGDTVTIEADAIAPATIHGYEVEIHRLNDTTKLFYAHVHDHNDTLQISKRWVNDRSTPVALEARITLTLDHEGHQLQRSVNFQAQ
ncbi:MAG: hypothetical protein EOO15_11880 [Chitinophagaceae bacterium]|nr:MAG: hypothetical protein EOO15_11880 [Chitinophagaceae bacterium]